MARSRAKALKTIRRDRLGQLTAADSDAIIAAKGLRQISDAACHREDCRRGDHRQRWHRRRIPGREGKSVQLAGRQGHGRDERQGQSRAGQRDTQTQGLRLGSSSPRNRETVVAREETPDDRLRANDKITPTDCRCTYRGDGKFPRRPTRATSPRTPPRCYIGVSGLSQRLVPQPMRPRAFFTQPLFLVRFVFLIVAVEELTCESPSNARMCVAMRSRNQRSCEITRTLPANSMQGVFERAQRLDVEIVRRLVEQQHVAALKQRDRQMQASALAAGELCRRSSAGRRP